MSVSPGQKDIMEAAASGDRLASLRALRDRLAGAIAVAEPREMASLTKAFRDTMADIAELGQAEAEAPKTALDELMARRASRKGA